MRDKPGITADSTTTLFRRDAIKVVVTVLTRLKAGQLGARAPALFLDHDLDDAAGGLIQLARLVFYNVVEV